MISVQERMFVMHALGGRWWKAHYARVGRLVNAAGVPDDDDADSEEDEIFDDDDAFDEDDEPVEADDEPDDAEPDPEGTPGARVSLPLPVPGFGARPASSAADNGPTRSDPGCRSVDALSRRWTPVRGAPTKREWTEARPRTRRIPLVEGN